LLEFLILINNQSHLLVLKLIKHYSVLSKSMYTASERNTVQMHINMSNSLQYTNQVRFHLAGFLVLGLPQRCQQQAPLKYQQLYTNTHEIISQKTWLFTNTTCHSLNNEGYLSTYDSGCSSENRGKLWVSVLTQAETFLLYRGS
jgi:hypothetical protein